MRLTSFGHWNQVVGNNRDDLYSILRGFCFGFEAGTRDWTSEDFKFTRLENDRYGLSMVRDLLFRKTRENKMSFVRSCSALCDLHL
jgi:hypothetical protein